MAEATFREQSSAEQLRAIVSVPGHQKEQLRPWAPSSSAADLAECLMELPGDPNVFFCSDMDKYGWNSSKYWV